MQRRDDGDETLFILKQDHRGIEHRTGGAHPGAEQCPVCRRFMLCMVSGMFRRLRLGQPTNREHTQHKKYRKECSEWVAHAIEDASQ